MGILDPLDFANLFKVTLSNIKEVLCGCLDLESFYNELLPRLLVTGDGDQIPLITIFDIFNS